MSSDNGVYIGKFKDGYRVTYAMGIDGCEDSPGIPQKISDAFRIIFFKQKDAKFFPLSEEKEAWEEAYRIHRDYGYTEYGVCMCLYDTRDLPAITPEEAEKLVDEYYRELYDKEEAS